MSIYHRGRGWWYDRDLKVYHNVFDHTADALAAPSTYRLTPADVAGFGGPDFEDVRDKVIPLICARHFIRIRWLLRRGTIGWQFCGDPADAREVLRDFCANRGVGPGASVTFTDFSFGELQLPLGRLLDGPEWARFQSDWETSRGVCACP